jgi:hypothetical protein
MSRRQFRAAPSHTNGAGNRVINRAYNEEEPSDATSDGPSAQGNQEGESPRAQGSGLRV